MGLDYSFNGKTYTFIEYHYNGAGTDRPEDYLTNIDQSAYTRGGVYLLGVHYLAPGINASTHSIDWSQRTDVD